MRRALLVVAFAALVLESCGTATTKTVIQPAPATSATPTTPTATGRVPSTVTTLPPSSAVYFEGVAGGPLQRPATLELTGDGTLFVSSVQWSSWGGATATGSGNAQYHGCTPNCAEATPHTALVAIRLFGIRVCSGRQYYSGLTLTLNSGRLLDRQFLQRSGSPC